LRSVASGTCICPQWCDGVVGDFTRPDQIPQAIERDFGIAATGRLIQIVKERSAPHIEMIPDRFMDRTIGWVAGHRKPEPGELGTEIERHPSIAAPERTPTSPHQLAFQHELIQMRAVVGYPRRQHVSLEDRGGKLHSLQATNRFCHRHPPAGRLRGYPLPLGCKTSECRLLHRLNLFPKYRQ